MKVGLLGKKIGMTRIFRENGVITPVTVIEMTPSVAIAVKNVEHDGYHGLKLAYGEMKEQRAPKAQQGVFKKLGLACKKYMYEVRSEQPVEGVAVGDQIGVDNFEAGDYVDISSISIGKGFQGCVKRHKFKGSKSFSHGDMSRKRTGSVGASAFPSRVMPGMRGAGRMGGKKVTTQNIEVVKVDVANNLLVVHGAVPGAGNNIVRVELALKKGKARPVKTAGANKETATANA